MSDRLEDTTTQESAEAGSESAVDEPADTETLATAEPAESQATESEPATVVSDPQPEAAVVSTAAEEVAEPPVEGGAPAAEAATGIEGDSAEIDSEAASTEAAEVVAADTEAAAEESASTAAADDKPADKAPAVVAAAEEATAGAPAVEAAAEAEDSAAEATTEADEPTAEATAETEVSPAEAAAETEVSPAEAAAETEVSPVEATAETEGTAQEAPTTEVEIAAEAESGNEASTDAAEPPTIEVKSDDAEEASKVESTAATPELKPETSEAMSELAKALAEKKLVKGQVIGWNKGGYHVAIGKIAAFCPVSQIEIGNPRSPKRYLDKTFSFRIIEIQNGGRRVVLSRSEAIKAEREQRAALVRELLQPGAELEGKVSSLTNFGAFVDLGGGIEGLVHVSEISRRRVEHPKEVLQSGQKVKVSVLKIEKGGQRISLSMKRLEPDPWKGVADRFPAGSTFSGTILRQTEFGLFVEVEPGLEGLVHTSRLALGQSLADETLEVGKKVDGWVHEVEAKRRRLSLSLREVTGGNPWQGVADRYPVGELTKGTVERLASFGVFIQLEPGLTGLLPFSVLGGSGGNPRRQYHVGKEVSIRVLSVDRDKKRISLGTENSKAEGNQQDYREYMKAQSRRKESSSGLNAMAAAFAKLKEQQGQQVQKS